jgi:hypothetical protein
MTDTKQLVEDILQFAEQFACNLPISLNGQKEELLPAKEVLSLWLQMEEPNNITLIFTGWCLALENVDPDLNSYTLKTAVASALASEDANYIGLARGEDYATH